MVVRPGPGRGAQAGDGSLGDLLPVQVVLAALGVKENVAGKVTPGNEPRVEHLRYAVGGEHVAVTADDDGGLGGPGVEQEPEAVSDFLGAGRGELRQWVGLREPVQVRHGLLVEAERPPDSLRDLRRRMAVAALLETRVVRAAHSREGGQFLPPQASSATANSTFAVLAWP